MLFDLSYSIASQGGRSMGGGWQTVEAETLEQAKAAVVAELRVSFDAPRAVVTFSVAQPQPPVCPLPRCAHRHTGRCAGCGCEG